MIEDEAILNPEKLLEHCNIERHHNVADFGCGPGIFSIPIARMNGDGKVYYFDVLESALEAVKSRAQVMGISNIVTKRVNLEKENGSGLGGDTINHIVMRKILVQNNDKEGLFREANRVLVAGGKLLVVGWQEDAMIGFGSTERLSEEDVIKFAQSTGFENNQTIDAGKYHYAIIFTK